MRLTDGRALMDDRITGSYTPAGIPLPKPDMTPDEVAAWIDGYFAGWWRGHRENGCTGCEHDDEIVRYPRWSANRVIRAGEVQARRAAAHRGEL